MTTPNFNNIAEQKINEFESLGTIHASGDWEKTLLAKINSSQANSKKTFPAAGYTLIFTMLIIVNLGVIFNHFKSDKKHSNIKSQEYQLLSNQLLVGQETGSD